MKGHFEVLCVFGLVLLAATPAAAQRAAHVRVTWDATVFTDLHARIADVPIERNLLVPLLSDATRVELVGMAHRIPGSVPNYETSFRASLCVAGSTVTLCEPVHLITGHCEFIGTGDDPRAREIDAVPVEVTPDGSVPDAWTIRIGPPHTSERWGGCMASSPVGTIPERTRSAAVAISTTPASARVLVGYYGADEVVSAGRTNATFSIPYEGSGESVVLFVELDGYLTRRIDLRIGPDAAAPIVLELERIRRE